MKDFFKKLMPEGFVVIAHPNGRGGFTHHVCDDVDMVQKKLAQLNPAERDLFFGLGTVRQRSVKLDNGRTAVRVKDNIAGLKSFFLDLDVGDAPNKYQTQEAAIASINEFSELNGFPKPMLVSSGRGVHVDWPLKKAVSARLWSDTAALFKQCLAAHGIKTDPCVTADVTQLLRVPGTINHKDGSPVRLLQDAEPTSGKAFVAKLFEMAKDLKVDTPLPNLSGGEPPEGFNQLGSNTQPTDDFPPSDFDRIKVECNQVKRMIATGCDTEPMWHAGLCLVKAVTDPEQAAIEISRNHPEYDEMVMRRKLAYAISTGVGPTTCDRLRRLNPKSCEGCRHKVTSPIQLGVTPVRLPQSNDIPIALPHPYVVGPRGEGVAIAGQEKVEICSMDVYPKLRVDDETTGEASTTWCFRDPRTRRFVEIPIPQSTLADPRALHRVLLGKSITVNHHQLLKMTNFMIAYIKKLQEEAQLEHKFSSLGWRDEDRSFVLGDKVYDRNGIATTHHLSNDIVNAIPGLESCGTLQGWIDAMQFYNAHGHEAHRFVLYAAFASIIYHMTGHTAALCFLTGKSGFGKTTVLRAVNSIFGHPSKLGVNGTTTGTTENAMYGMLGKYHNIPMCLDDMSHWESKLFARFALCISQGSGKRRSTKSGGVSNLLDLWSLIAFASGNSDAYTTLASARSDVLAEAMRIFQIQMTLPSTYSVDQANHFANTVMYQNYGLAGHAYVPWVTKNYDKVRDVLHQNMDRVSRESRAISSERYWTSIIASAATSGSIVRRIGLLPDFPVEKDIAWAVSHMNTVRTQVVDNSVTPSELLSEYLSSRINETLTVLTNDAGHVRIDSEPRNNLLVRRDLALKTAQINRKDFRNYCIERGCVVRDVINALTGSRVIIANGSLITLGRKTAYAAGQIRAIEIDLDRLETLVPTEK